MTDELQNSLRKAYAAHQAGRLDEARSLYRDVLARSPRHADANNLMGLLCIQAGEPVRAMRHIRRALDAEPGNAQSHYNLGIAFKDQERWPEAADAFAQAVQLDEDNSDYQASLGNALRLAGRPGEAVQVLERGLRKATGNRSLKLNLALAQNDLGARLVRTGDPAQALRHFIRAVELEPRHAQAQLNLGLTLEQIGELERAAQHYRAAIGAKADFADAHFQLAHLRTHASTEAEISAMKSLVDEPGATEPDRIRLAYGLGFALESAGRHAEAFTFMNRAHELQSQRTRFDLAKATERFELIRDVFDVQRLRRPEASGNPDERPVFITGMPRSGTTLAEQVLSGHPAVHATGESMALARAARLLSPGQLPFPEGLERLREEQLAAAAETWLADRAGDAGDALRVTDTTPMNFLFAGLAALLFPDARFVFCLRDPMDNGLSIYRQMLTGANEFTHTLENLGGYYRLHRDLLDHWASALRERALFLQYEDLVRDNEPQVRRLLEFCGLPFDERCLRFYESDRVVRSPSAAQVRQPVFDTSIGAWKNYRQELQPLKDALAGPA
jgi:tetratricopeptide (TPR) repeat protein